MRSGAQEKANCSVGNEDVRGDQSSRVAGGTGGATPDGVRTPNREGCRVIRGADAQSALSHGMRISVQPAHH